MEVSTGVNKNDKDGIQEEDSHKEVTQRNVKHEKSMIKDKKSAFKFVGNRICNDDSKHKV